MPGLDWVKSSRSNQQHLDDCLAVASTPDGMVAIGDTKDPGATPLVYRKSEFAAFLAGAKAGEFDHLA
ncbi:DUF397 domain-containing protein [Streptomyces sp. PH10-H1]|nr:DUF397 domain-containing protein [Streptomyces sp. PH10-H1]MDJ0346736.1 DUF397 domain-containing protein [Streptomyces sp. PH10-H1]